MHVLLPSPLFSYTRGQMRVEATADSLAQLLVSLDARFPGLRHRIIDEQDRVRRHIRMFVNGEATTSLDQRLRADDEVLIVAALSGG